MADKSREIPQPVILTEAILACCGATGFTNFFNPPSYHQYRSPIAPWGKTSNPAFQKSGEEFLEGHIMTSARSHGFFCILIDSEMKMWWPVLQRLGFKVLCRWQNGGRNWCNLLGLVALPTNEEVWSVSGGYGWDSRVAEMPWIKEALTNFVDR